MSTAEDTDQKMELLERRAKVIRSRLLRAVDALDARRHQVVEVGETAKKLAVPAAAAIVGIAVIFGASAFAFSMAWRARRRRSLGARIAEAIRELDLSARPSLARRLFDRTALTIVSIATTELARRALKNVLDGRLLDGRLAIGRALDAHHAELAEGDRASGMILRPNGGVR